MVKSLKGDGTKLKGLRSHDYDSQLLKEVNIMKRTMFVNCKKILSVFVVLMVTMSLLAVPASAATSSRSISNSRTSTVNVQTGSGWQYSLGWKKTTVTFTNTSRSGAVTVKAPGGVSYYVQRGCSRTFTLYGNQRHYQYGVQRSGVGSRSYRVRTSAGSIW